MSRQKTNQQAQVKASNWLISIIWDNLWYKEAFLSIQSGSSMCAE